ncbi:MAG: hypothetical protein K2N94_10955 [Lachnospiraceae bacterium]|nr:hypothetical protein [Lachnospiraceae bacterium]
MLKKKFFAKALAFAMVTGLLAAAPAGAAAPVAVHADEAKATPVTATITYSNLSIHITAGADATGKQDNYVFLEVMKKENDTKQGTVYAFPLPAGEGGGAPVTPEVPDEPETESLVVQAGEGSERSVTVDLSFLKITKACYLRVWGDKSQEKVTLTVSPQPAKIKYKYAAQTFPVPAEGEDAAAEAYQAKLRDYYAKSFGITDASLNYQIRSLYGGTGIDLADTSETPDGKWDFAENSDNAKTSDMLATLKVTGGTVEIWQAAKENTTKTVDGKKVIDKAGAPAGVAVKVKIPAAPKAPKVTVDYAKGTIKLPKNAEFGIIYEGSLTYASESNGGTFAPEVILGKIADKLEIKDATTGTDAEKIARTTFINTNLANGFDLVVRTNDSKKGVSNPAFVAVKKTASYDDDKWGKITLSTTTTDADGAETTTKTTIAEYEFTDTGVKVTAKSGSFEYEEGGKWKKISDGKEIKGKTELVIRQAGVKDKDESKATLPSAKMTIKKPVNKSKVEIDSTGAANLKMGTTTTGTLSVKTGALNRDGEEVDIDDTKTKWESSDTAVATVNATSGAVEAKGAGKCTIKVTVTFEDGTTAEGTVEITVAAADASSGS